MPEFRAPDQSKITKEEANYRPLEKCSLCVNFIPPNSCEVVEGNISPDAVSNTFRLREPVKLFDKQFYIKQFKEG